MLLHFVAGDAGVEVVVVGDSDFLVSCQGGFGDEVVEGAVALLDPAGCLGKADAVHLEEFLQGFVIGVEFGVVEAAELVGPHDLFDFVCETLADEGDLNSFGGGGDFDGVALFELAMALR